MNEEQNQALWVVNSSALLERKLKSWITFIVFVTLWLTFLAWLWKLVIL